MTKQTTKKKEKKIIVIDLEAENPVNFSLNLGVSDTLMLIGILNQLQNSMLEHLTKNLYASHVKFGQECATLRDMEMPLTPEKSIELIDKVWK